MPNTNPTLVLNSPSNNSENSQVSPLQASKVNPMLTLSNNDKPIRKNEPIYEPVVPIDEIQEYAYAAN